MFLTRIWFYRPFLSIQTLNVIVVVVIIIIIIIITTIIIISVVYQRDEILVHICHLYLNVMFWITSE
jgi:hypothetical protein